MFYKKLEEGLNSLVELDGNLESIMALYKNCPDFLQPYIIKASFRREKNGGDGNNFFLCYLDNNIEDESSKEIIKKDIFLNEKGAFAYRILENISYIDVNSIEAGIDMDLLNENINRLNQVSFQKECSSGFFEDKFGEKYSYTIVHNADPTLFNSPLIADKLYVFNSKKEMIGRLIVKYTNKEIVDKIYKNPSEKLKNTAFKMTFEHFDNCASIDYSSILPNYQNKGIGKQMYKKMIEYTLNSGKNFRPSNLQSSQAKNLWKSLSNEYNFLEKLAYNGEPLFIIKKEAQDKKRLKI